MNDRMDELIGEILKERRKELNYSMQDIANFMKTSKTTVHNWEKGISSMNISTIIKVCGFLRTDYIKVLERAEKEYYGSDKV